MSVFASPSPRPSGSICDIDHGIQASSSKGTQPTRWSQPTFDLLGALDSIRRVDPIGALGGLVGLDSSPRLSRLGTLAGLHALRLLGMFALREEG